MAGIYRQYTMTSKMPIGASWRCSNCGAENATIGLVVTQGGYNDKDAWSQKAIDKREKYATERLNERSTDKYKKALSDAKERKFNEILFGDCRCKACGNVEPWSKNDNALLIILQKITFYIAIMISAFQMLDIESINWMFFCMVWIPCLACVSIRYLIRFFFQMKINNLEEKSCPTLIDLRGKMNT